MATFRMTASAGAALIALMAIVPATSQAQAPLQLLPGPNQAKKTTGTVSNKKATKAVAKTPGKASRTVASRNKAVRPNSAAAQPASKTARTNSRTTTTGFVAGRRQGQVTTNAQRARAATIQRVPRAVVAAPRPAPDHTVPAPGPQILAYDSDDNVMRGGSSVALVARLPWWRNDRLQPVTYGSAEADSKVMAAAEAWLAANRGGRATERADDERTLVDDVIDVADADEVNEIDLAAGSVPAPQSPSFLQSLLALIGGAAVAAAASARLLFT